jgi:hypothetical protein
LLHHGRLLHHVVGEWDGEEAYEHRHAAEHERVGRRDQRQRPSPTPSPHEPVPERAEDCRHHCIHQAGGDELRNRHLRPARLPWGQQR